MTLDTDIYRVLKRELLQNVPGSFIRVHAPRYFSCEITRIYNRVSRVMLIDHLIKIRRDFYADVLIEVEAIAGKDTEHKIEYMDPQVSITRDETDNIIATVYMSFNVIPVYKKLDWRSDMLLPEDEHAF